MDNHKFKPFDNLLTGSKICAVCYRPKLDAFHLDELGPENIVKEIPVKAKNFGEQLTLVDGFEVPFTGNAVKPINQGAAPEPFIQDNQLVFSQRVEGINKGHDSTNAPDCFGHTCPECGVTWLHTYKCWPDSKISDSMYCAAHFGQSISEIHRNEDIGRLTEKSNSARALIEARLLHKAFVILEARKLPDFEEFCANHIRGLREKIELFQNQCYATTEALADMRKEDGSKLTQAEIEAYRRAAARNKKSKFVNPAHKETPKISDAKKAWNEQLKGLISLVGDKDKATAKLTKLYTAQGKEIPKS